MKAALSVDSLFKTFDLGFFGAVPFIGPMVTGLQIKGLAQRVEAVRGVSFSVEPGEIFGFLGPNGAGKTTTIKMLMGLIHPSSGSGTLLGAPLGDRAARARLGFLPEHPYFYDYLKPLEFLDFYGRLFCMSAQDRRRRADELVDRVGLRHAVNRPLRKYSKGMIQRIGIAQALMNDPDLVVFDEPMSGLDPMGRKDVRDLIFELKEQGKTVFFSSHILQDVEAICDRVAIMVKGRLRSIGPLSELLSSPNHQVEVWLSGLSSNLLEHLRAQALQSRELDGQWSFLFEEEERVNDLLKEALGEGARLISLKPHRRSLEDLFVAEAQRDEVEKAS